MQHLKDYWNLTCKTFSVSQEVSHVLWKDLEEAYSSPSRYYHHLVHIQQMINLAYQFQSKLKRYHLVNLAIFYHDVVYDASRQDNEFKSWEYAFNHLKPFCLNKSDLSFIKDGILATQGHQPQSNSDIAYLLDFDLSILGKTWETYSEYTKQIRLEYAIYPDKIYVPGRILVLKHFLESGSIYQTLDFKDQFEIQALSNLNREKEELQQRLSS